MNENFENNFNEDYLCYIGFPRPDTKIDLINDFFGLLVHLSGIKCVEKRYTERKIPLEYMKASYKSVGIWIDSFREFFGRWGHNREFPRMVYIENLRIIRIGRLEFEINKFRGKAVVLKNKLNGTAVAVSEGNVPIGRGGLVNGTNGIWDAHGTLTFYDENDSRILAQRIENGKITKETSEFSKSEWSTVARQGENSLNLHIPRGERLDVTAVRESISEAEAFYARYFPERKFKIFECHSWLFDGQLEEMLGENSGIVKFQKEFCLFPEPLGDFGALVSVFTEAPFDLLEWNPKTTLQRKIIEHYKNGGKMMGAGGFIMPTKQ